MLLTMKNAPVFFFHAIELKLHQYVPMTHEMHMTIIDLCDTAFSLNCKPRINIDNDNHF